MGEALGERAHNRGQAARVRLLGLLQVFGSNVLPLPKRDKIDGSVSARVKLVYFELLCAPIGQEHREHVAIMCWGPNARNFGGWRSGSMYSKILADR